MSAMTQTKPHIAIWLDLYDHGPEVVLNSFTREDKAAFALAAKAGGRVTAILPASSNALSDAQFWASSKERLREEVASYGARDIVVLCIPPSDAQNPEALASTLAWCISQEVFNSCPVTDIVASANATGRDLLARTAAELNVPLLQDCIALNFANGSGEKYLLSGRTCGLYQLPGPLRCWTLRPNVFPTPEGKGSGKAFLHILEPPVRCCRIREVPPPRQAREEEEDSLARMWEDMPDIMEAAVIVSGGRAVGSAEKFTLLHEVAQAMHAAVGASRSAVDMGYAPAGAQIGQTGALVSPDLYIACGISGSIFHLAGIKTARKVIAINTDVTAPIFARADYGLPDDLFAALPLLLEQIRLP
jgi:electron transfer flavoprotein alpha subunit